jgi:hypothetical protein
MNSMVIGTNLYQIIKEHYFDDYNFEELDESCIIDRKEKYHVYAVKGRNANISALRHDTESKLDLNRSNFFSLKKKPKSLSIGQQQTKAHPRNILIVDANQMPFLLTKHFWLLKASK